MVAQCKTNHEVVVAALGKEKKICTLEKGAGKVISKDISHRVAHHVFATATKILL